MPKERKLIEITLKSEPIVAKVKKLSANWTFKEGRGVFGHGTEYYYYETVEMSKDVTRYYARAAIAQKLDEDDERKVMKWIKRKFFGPKSGWTILREGSNFYDVISTDKLSKL